jgi:L-glutamine-phosphate cytidylyltransferase
MKAVILAAGQGTRIRSIHGERPKCLIDVDGRTILDHQLDALCSAGINDVAIVVGYEKEQVISHAKRRNHHDQKIQFIDNSAFALTNNVYSLWLSLEWLSGDAFVCLNADVIFDSGILASAVQSVAPISMIVDPLWRDETMKVITSHNRVLRMSKGIPREEFSGTYIGITIFSHTIQERFFSKMGDVIAAGRIQEFFNVAVQALADEGVQVGYTSTDGLPWAEIDDPFDLTFAQQNIFPQLAARGY